MAWVSIYAVKNLYDQDRMPISRPRDFLMFGSEPQGHFGLLVNHLKETFV